MILSLYILIVISAAIKLGEMLIMLSTLWRSDDLIAIPTTYSRLLAHPDQ